MPRKIFSISVDPYVYAKFREVAQKEGLSTSRAIEILMKRYSEKGVILDE